jgi:hypothetical protein
MNAAKKIQKKGGHTAIMSLEEYHANEAIGSSSIKNILRSPAHYLYESQNPSEPTTAMAFGTACHEAILEPEKFLANVTVMPKFEGTGSRAAKDQWLLENHGKRILKAEDLANIHGMLKAISGHKTARSLLSGGRAEESYFDECPETGIKRKARPDFLRDGHIIVDVKTTIDASPEAFAKAIANFNYHISGAYYLDVVGNVLGRKFDQFVIIAIEKEAPYGISVHMLEESTIEAGQYLYRKALRTLSECRKTNNFHGYPDHILTTAIPPWAFPAEVVNG